VTKSHVRLIQTITVKGLMAGPGFFNGKCFSCDKNNA